MPLTLLGAGLLVVGCVGRRRILNASTPPPQPPRHGYPMRNNRYIRHVAVALAAALVAVSIGLLTRGGNAHGDTIAGTLVGEGGDAMTPVMLSLLNDDSSQLAPDTASYTNVNLDQAISDFVGTGTRIVRSRFCRLGASVHRRRDGNGDHRRPVLCVRPLCCDPGCAHDPGAALQL